MGQRMVINGFKTLCAHFMRFVRCFICFFKQEKDQVMSDKKLREIVENHVPGLFLILSVFAMLEFGILVVCVVYSGNQDVVKIYSPNNEVIYEDVYNMSYITEFKKLYGIENFKEEGFVVTRVGIDNKFPTRAWIALSICVPLVLILFVVFIVRVFADVFYSKKADEAVKKKEKQSSDFEETKFEKLFSTLGRLNVYSLGCTVIFIAFFYWMVPDLLVYLGKISYQTVSELKWVILGVVLLGGTYMIVTAFLSHKTKNEIIRQQAEIQKNRDRLVIEAKLEKKLLENRLN
jgi:hypothetical protein